MNSADKLNSSMKVIDIEAAEISFAEARAIRNQIRQDCELLRNRVRMLKDEMARARRKIDETERKAEKVEALKVQREMSFMRKREEA